MTATRKSGKECDDSGRTFHARVILRVCARVREVLEKGHGELRITAADHGVDIKGGPHDRIEK